MKFIETEKEARLAEIKAIYLDAKNSMVKMLERFRRDNNQYKGKHIIEVSDPDGDSSSEIEVAESDVYNISFELTEGSIETDIPQPKVSPEMKCEHHLRNARRVENLLRMLRDKNPTELRLDMEERMVKVFSAVGINIEWDTELVSQSNVGDIKEMIIMPHNIIPQPGIVTIDDCDYVFVEYITTHAAIKRKYNIDESELEKTEYDATAHEYGSSGEHVDNDSIATLVVMWYKNEEGNICRYIFSGELVLADEDDYYSRKVSFCKCCNRREEICRNDKCDHPEYEQRRLDYDELVEDVVCSDGRIIPAMTPVYEDGVIVTEKIKQPVLNDDGTQAYESIGGELLQSFIEIEVPKMQPTRLPYYKPRKIPLSIRHNIKDYNSFWGVSDMEIIRPQQEACDKLTCRINEAIRKSGAVLFKPEDADMEYDNGIFNTVVELDSSMDKSQFGMFSYGANISQWISERNLQKEQAKKLLGISDTYLGQADTTAKSGYAKAVQIQQSAGRLASKRMMKYASFSDRDRIKFELYLAFADEPRQIHHEDADCQIYAGERFNRYDFYEFDPKTGKWYIDDNYFFAVDLEAPVESQKVQMWELIKSDFSAGMYGTPESPEAQLKCWKHLERVSYPGARAMVEDIRRVIENVQAPSEDNDMSGAVNANIRDIVAEQNSSSDSFDKWARRMNRNAEISNKREA